MLLNLLCSTPHWCAPDHLSHWQLAVAKEMNWRKRIPSNGAVSPGNVSCLAPESPHHPEHPSPVDVRSDSGQEARPRLAPSPCISWLVGGGARAISRRAPRLTSTRTDLGCCGNPFSLYFLLQFLCQHLLLLFRLLWVTSKQRGGQSRS